MTTNLPATNDWPEGLVVDYAMMKASEVAGLAPLYSLHDIAAMYSVDVEAIKVLEQNTDFVRQVRAEMMEIKKTSPHLQKKATILLEAWLDCQAAVWLASESSVAEKLKVIEQITKISGLLEKQKAAIEAENPNSQPQNGYQPTIMINFTGTPQVVEKAIN